MPDHIYGSEEIGWCHWIRISDIMPKKLWKFSPSSCEESCFPADERISHTLLLMDPGAPTIKTGSSPDRISMFSVRTALDFVQKEPMTAKLASPNILRRTCFLREPQQGICWRCNGFNTLGRGSDVANPACARTVVCGGKSVLLFAKARSPFTLRPCRSSTTYASAARMVAPGVVWSWQTMAWNGRHETAIVLYL